MERTFERRLKPIPAKARLGRNNAAGNLNKVDLRNKLNSTSRVPDARSILRNRIRRGKFTFRDARNVLKNRNRVKPLSRPTVPFLIPTRTIKNDLFSARFSSSRSRGRGRNAQLVTRQPVIPDLLSLPTPVVPLNLMSSTPVHKGLFANFVPHVESLTAIANAPSGSKPSPIQGYRLQVRNLHTRVTLDDVYDLFSSVGSLRLCTLLRPGQAEVVFNHASDALEAVERYNGRELDGRPMQVTLVTPHADTSVELDSSGRMASRLGPNFGRKQAEVKAKQVIREAQTTAKVPVEIDVDVVRKALFNVSSSSGNQQPRRPVDFNVSLR